MSEIKSQNSDATLILKNREIDSLKAQNERLIEKLQEEVDKSTKEFIHKEILHKEVIKIQHALREVFQQGQSKKSVFEKIFNKIDEYEIRLQEQQKNGFAKYNQNITATISNEVEALKLEVIKTQAKITETLAQVKSQNKKIQTTQMALAAILKKLVINPATFQEAATAPDSPESAPATSASTAPNTDSAAIDESFFITDDEIEKIEGVLKSEFNSNQDEVNLIFQMLSEKNEAARGKNQSQ